MKFSLLLFLSFAFQGFAQQNLVEDLKIEGTKKIKISFIKKITDLKPESRLDTLVIEKDIKRLKRLPSVAHAYYQVFHSKKNRYNVFYYIEENFTTIPSVNIYTSNNNEFAYRLGVNEFNLLGRSISFGGYYQKDIFDSYAINFKAPYLFSKQFGLAISYQDLTSQEPVFINNATADYKYNNNSFEVLGLYKINFHNKIELGLNYFQEKYSYINGATSPDVPQLLDIKKVLYKLLYEYDNLNYYYQYVWGFRSILNFQYVRPVNGELHDFFIGWNDFLYYKRIGELGNWANRLRLGIASNSNSPFAPFSVENNINVRGVGNAIDRGTAAIVLNTEYRFTLYEKKSFLIQGNTFIDAGTWRRPGGNLSDLVNIKNTRIYPGLGLRFIHKKIFNAIFRIDYGYGITKDAAQGFVFGIGQYF